MKVVTRLNTITAIDLDGIAAPFAPAGGRLLIANLTDVLRFCIYRWFSPGMSRKTASTGENMAFHSRRRRGFLKIRAPSRIWIASLTPKSDGIQSAPPAALRSCLLFTQA